MEAIRERVSKAEKRVETLKNQRGNLINMVCWCGVRWSFFLFCANSNTFV